MENNYNINEIPAGQNLNNNEIRKPTLAQVSILYSAAVILLIYVGYRVQRLSLYPGLLITEFGLILVPSLVLLYIYRYDIRQVLRLNKTGLLNLSLIFGIMLSALPVVGVLNAINLFIINNIFGKVLLPELPAVSNSYELVISILIIAGSAAICEEVMFRGVIQRGLERFGTVKAILITAFLFGLLHLDFQRFLGTFLLGALIGFIVYRSNSLFSGMFAHFCNNSFAVLAAYVSNKFIKFAESSGMSHINKNADSLFSSFAAMPKEQLVSFMLVWGFIFIFFLSALIGLIVAFIVTTSGKVQKVKRETIVFKKAGLLWLAPGLMLVSLMYIAEGLRLNNATSALAKGIMKIIGLR